MKAITLPQFGGPEALVLADVETPTPAPARCSCASPPQA